MKVLNPKRHSSKRQQGSTLIEAMVAVVLLSVGLLGAIALQVSIQKEQRAAHYSGMAAQLAAELADRMRGNRLALQAGYYNSSTPPVTNTYDTAAAATAQPVIPINCQGSNECTTMQDAAARDIALAARNISLQMPGAALSVLPVASGTGISLPLSRDIVIAWEEPVIDKAPDGSPLPVTPATSGCPANFAPPDRVRCYVLRFTL